MWSFLCPPPSSTSPSCRRIVVACNSGVRDGGENSGNVASPHRNAVIHPACISSLSSVPRHASFLSLSLYRALATSRSFTALSPRLLQCVSAAPMSSPAPDTCTYFYYLYTRNTHARTHARTRSAECYRWRAAVPRCRGLRVLTIRFTMSNSRHSLRPHSLLRCPLFLFIFCFFFVFRCSLGFSLDSHATIGTYPRRPKKSRTPRSLAQRRATPSSAKIRRDSHLFHLPREISWGLRSIRTERNAQIFRRVFSPFLLFLTLSLSLTRSLCLTRSFSTVSNSVSPIPSVSFLRLPSHGAIVLPHLQLLTGHQLRDHINPRDGKIDARRF